MTDIFLKILNTSVTASYLVVAVLMIRLILKKAPKWCICLLWGIVALRLVMPFSFESNISLVPSVHTVVVGEGCEAPFEINTGVDTVDDELNGIIIENKDTINRVNDIINSAVPVPDMATQDAYDVPQDNFEQTSTEAAPKIKVSIFTIMGLVWALGVLTMLMYSAISFILIRKRVRVCVPHSDNIYYCDNIDTSFILGILRPKIYIQSDMSQQNAEYVIKHEQSHLKRCDYLIKPMAFLLLSVHWFNPLIWVSYILLCRDIESACDEKVIKNARDIDVQGYSTALLNCSTKRRLAIACPVAFGELSVKSRIKAVLRFKRAPKWLCVASVALSVVVAVCFLTDPIQKVDALSQIVEYETVTEYIERTQSDKENVNSSSDFLGSIFPIFKNDKNKDAQIKVESEMTSANNSGDSQNGNSVSNSIDSENVTIDKTTSEDIALPENDRYDDNISQDNITSEEIDSDKTTSEIVAADKNKTVIDASNYTYKIGTNVQDFFVDGDTVHMLLNDGYNEKYRYIVFDSNIGSIVAEHDTGAVGGEMNCFDNELWISYPQLQSIKIYDKKTFAEKETLHLGTPVHSFDLYNDYLIYSDSNQWVKVYRYNLKTKEKTKFRTDTILDAFYDPDVLVNRAAGLVYVGESSMTGSKLFCYDIATMTLLRKYSVPLDISDNYGYPNGQRRMILRDGYLYWGAFKLDSLSITTVISSYGVNLSAANNFDGMLQVTDKYVVMESGIYDKETCQLLYAGKNYPFRNTLIVTKSGNVIFSDATKLYVELGAIG